MPLTQAALAGTALGNLYGQMAAEIERRRSDVGAITGFDRAGVDDVLRRFSEAAQTRLRPEAESWEMFRRALLASGSVEAALSATVEPVRLNI